MSKQSTRRFSLIAGLLAAISLNTTLAQTLAFPEAEGYGRYTEGGRGGTVYIVTSLTDDGDPVYETSPSGNQYVADVINATPGTLRYALNQSGPRLIVFAVSGVIDLQHTLFVKNPYVTIAGQTSPGGIVLKGADLNVQTDQVIVRYLRMRPGIANGEQDAFRVRDLSNVIIDHCSASWTGDEIASAYAMRNVTFQYSLFAQPLNLRDENGNLLNHGYGGIFGGSGASYYRNVVAHFQSRAPRVTGYMYNYNPNLLWGFTDAQALTDVRNIVIYNPQYTNQTYGNEDSQLNLINNYYKAGPGNSVSQHRIFRFSESAAHGRLPGSAYIDGNVVYGDSAATNDNWSDVFGGGTQATAPYTSAITVNFTDQDYKFNTSTMTSANSAFDTIVYGREVGANRNYYGPHRDSVDTNLLKDIKYRETYTGGNGIIENEHEAISSWTAYEAEFTGFAPYVDADTDGMADEWELAKGVSDPYANDLHDVYNNIEVYINELGAFSTEDETPEILAHWDFEGDFEDNFGQNDAVSNVLPGKISTQHVEGSNSGFYGGNQDFQTVASSGDLNQTRNFSVSAWIKPSDLTSTVAVFSKLTDASDKQYSLFVLSDGQLAFAYERDGNNFAVHGGTVQVDTWQLVTATVDANLGIKLYIDNELVAEDWAPIETVATTEPATIGRWSGSYGSHYFKGRIDEIRFYKGVLTPEYIEKIWDSSCPTCETPGAIMTTEWEFENNLDDSKGLKGLAWNGGSAAESFIDQSPLEGNYSAELDGSTDYLERPSTRGLNVTRNFSISARIRPDSITGFQGIVTKLTDSANRQYGLTMRDGKLRFEYRSNGVGNHFEGGSLLAGATYLVTVTVDKDLNAKLYVDDVEVASRAISAESIPSDEAVTVGRWGGTYDKFEFDGKLDAVRFFQGALSPSQVAALHNGTL